MRLNLLAGLLACTALAAPPASAYELLFGGVSLPLAKVIGTCSLTQYEPNFASLSETARGTAYQNWLLKCQRDALSAGAAVLSNVMTRDACIEAVSDAQSITLNTPIVIPRYVCWNPKGTFIRNGSAGSITSNWTGDTTVKALANIYQPSVILPPKGQMIGTSRLYLNSTGSDRGSGLFYGRTWRIRTLTIASGGSGFSGGETCTVANGDGKGPAAGATFTVASASGGAAATLTYAPARWDTQTGQYYLPPALQALQWTSANGWDGHDTYHPTVFSGSNYVTTCSAGTGLTVTPTWWPDWCDGSNGCSSSTTYDGDFGNLSASTGYLGNVVAVQSGNSVSASYGTTRNVAISAYDVEIDRIQTGQGGIGVQIFGSDLRANFINDVGSARQLVMFGGGAFHINSAILDTPTDSVNNDAHFLEIDKCKDCTISHLAAFHNTSSAATMAGNGIRLGTSASSDATHENVNVLIRGSVFSDGSSGSNLTALGCAYTRGSTIDLNVSNIGTGGSARAHQFTTHTAFGTSCEASNRITGSIDNVSNVNVTSGTVPALDMRIFSALDGVIVGLRGCQTIAQSGVQLSTTGSTSEKNLASIALPRLLANDALEIESLWHQGGTATNNHNLEIRLGTSACTPGATCTTGTQFLNANLNSGSLITAQNRMVIQNVNATNVQVAFPAQVSTFTTSGSALTAGAIETGSAVAYLNFNGQNASSSSDTTYLDRYSVKLCRY